MKWLEIIELRINPREKPEVEQDINDWLDEQKGIEENGRIEIYKRACVDTDLHIQIFHANAEAKPGFSVAGIELAGLLKKHGLVNHNIWIEMERKI